MTNLWRKLSGNKKKYYDKSLKKKFSGDKNITICLRRQGEQRWEQRDEAGANQRGLCQVKEDFYYYFFLLQCYHYCVRNIPAFKDGSNIVEDGASWSQNCGSDLEIWNLGSRNPKIWNLGSGNREIGSNLIQQNMKLIIDKYRALPPTVRRRTLSSTAPKKSKYLPKPKTEHSTQWEQKYLWIVISRIVNSGLW